MQINLNHCEAAQDLLRQSVTERMADVVIISEQYANFGNRNVCIADASNRAAVWVCGRYCFQETSSGTESGFVRAKINGIHVYSCYASPNAPIDEFRTFLDKLTNDARDRHPLVIAGDFNAWAVEWGSRETNGRGTALLEAFASLRLSLVNTGNTPTFRRGNTCSVIDITYMSGDLANRTAWEVCESYTHSDHQALWFELADRSQRGMSHHQNRKMIGWKAKSFDEAVFLLMMEDITLSGTAENKATQLMRRITQACDVAMPRRRESNRRKPVFWWSDEIAELRRKCLRARRQHQRAAQAENPVLRQQYREARSELKHAIKRSKRKCFQELCDEVDHDPWGRPYLSVMRKIRGNNSISPSCPVMLGDIVSELFPQQPECLFDVAGYEDEDVPAVTAEEVLKACSRFGNSKAPGPDHVPNIALKSAVRKYSNSFSEVYTSCLKEGIFPGKWKEQKLVLIPKGDKPAGEPSSYRPICLLDTAGKVLERIVCDRLHEAIAEAGGLAEHQYGFRKARSTTDAIRCVVDIAQETMVGVRPRFGRKYCAMVTLDVRNAFNTASWSCIFDALTRMNVPRYLLKLVASYFNRRVLKYDTDDGPRTHPVTGGVPQGSVLGPTLWNVMYDGVLRLPVPSEVKIIGFADDVALVVTAKYREEVVEVCTRTVRQVRQWLATVGLQLAEHKTEAVLITGRYRTESITLEVGAQAIVSQPSIRYLGVMIDSRLSYKSHLITATQKARRVTMALARLMPNTRGAGQNKRRLLASVTTSTLMYAAPIWANSMERESYRRMLASVQRLSALRVVCAYRTVSYDAVCVLAGMPPADLLAKERQATYLHRNRGPASESRRTARAETMAEWQRRWEDSTKGRWTHRLIPSIETWLSRKHGEVDYYLTQFLTGHGCFRAYLHRFHLDDSPYCPMCKGMPETAEHVLFECPRFQVERDAIGAMGPQTTPDNIISIMLESEDSWSAVCGAASKIGKELRSLERARSVLRS